MSLTIVGTVVSGYTGDLSGHVDIPYGITEIGANAFINYSGITSVFIPETVKICRYGAFASCSSLAVVTGCVGVETIENGAFSGCIVLASIPAFNALKSCGAIAFNSTGITSVNGFNSLTQTGDSMFSNCTNLSSVSGFNSLTTLGTNTFGGCTSLSSITLPSTLTTIGGNVFYNCTSLTNINLPSSLLTIGTSAFYASGLTSIIIPNSVTSIDMSVFRNCTNLASVTLSNSLTTIPLFLFFNCTSLTSLIIPASVTSIAAYPFTGSNPTLYFLGNKPTVVNNRISGDDVNINVYYKTSTTGWDTWTTLNTTLIVWAESQVPCFLANAPVLTPSGYKRIASLKVGDLVTTPAGTHVPIQRVKVTQVSANPNTNPYIIPKGMFGATLNLAISPNHRVATSRGMIEARNLGLQQKQMFDSFNYYNIELPECANMIVAGVEVESLAPVRRITVPLQTFKAMIAKKYGSIDASVAQKILKTCKLLSNGHIECPVIKNTQ